MSTEIWASVEINGTPTHFQISNHGQLKNLKTNRIRKPLVNPTTGYCTQQLRVDGVTHFRYIHRLVAECFIPNDDPTKKEIHHLSKDKQDNSVENLIWTDHRGNKFADRKLSQEQVVQAKQMYVAEMTLAEIAAHFNVTPLTISVILNNRQKNNIRVGNCSKKRAAKRRNLAEELQNSL